MVITRLVRGVRNPQKIAVYVDSKYTFSVLEYILTNENLYIGKELSEKELESIKSVSKNQEIKNKVIALISRRPRSEKEVIDYLRNRVDVEAIPSLISELKEKDYINDQSFANWWIDQRKTYTNKSKNIIRQELVKKGIARDIIDSQLENIDESDDLQSAKELLTKKKRLLEHKNLEKRELDQKLITYLQGRGFTWEIIKKVLDNDENN